MNDICATPQGNGTSNGTIVTVWECTGAAIQQWSYDGTYLKNVVSGKCLTPQGDASGTPGTVLTLWTCTNAMSQRFVAEIFTRHPQINTYYGGMCITDKGDSQAFGTYLTLWTCNSSYPDSQWWKAP
ncbi:RICIN domain-containing protein [Streptomyces sp. NPDC059697]|uniref:RICIN domain-containing protein n=1 Tax=Streptomyces sp. NPDC059697 TaxID=3346912 RepID=UPI0036BFFC29